MPRRSLHEPLSRGVTLTELAVGVAAAATLSLVLAGLFKAGFTSYGYAMRWNYVESGARKSFSGDGPRAGVLDAVRQAAAVRTLSAGSVELTAPGVGDVSYYVADSGLWQSRAGAAVLQAGGVVAEAPGYYGVDGTGRVVESTAPESAALVTVQLSMRGVGPSPRRYEFFSGAALRNRP